MGINKNKFTKQLPSSFSIRILLISRVSRFWRTLSKIQAAIMSDGTRSVPRNRALNKLATCVNASWPNSSFRKQQNIQRKRRSQRFETLGCKYFLKNFSLFVQFYFLLCDALLILLAHYYRYCRDFFYILPIQVGRTQSLIRR